MIKNQQNLPLESGIDVGAFIVSFSKYAKFIFKQHALRRKVLLAVDCDTSNSDVSSYAKDSNKKKDNSNAKKLKQAAEIGYLQRSKGRLMRQGYNNYKLSVDTAKLHQKKKSYKTNQRCNSANILTELMKELEMEDQQKQ